MRRWTVQALRPGDHILRRSFVTSFPKYDSKVPAQRDGSGSSVPNSPEIPPAPVHRVTYEYPPPPDLKPTPPHNSAWRRHLPLIAGVGGLLWAVYAWNYLFNPKNAEQTALNPEKFSTFRVTCKQKISPDIELIELAPKYSASIELARSGGKLWNGKKLWSIEVKHPDLQIARRYTPLPLYFMQYRKADGETVRLLKIIGDSHEEGRLVLMVKRYADGEMSRYLHNLKEGSDIEIRGPYFEHKFPYGKVDMQQPRQPMLDVPTRVQPDPPVAPASIEDVPNNVAFYTAGTGIAPAFQYLLTPINPPRGFVDVYYSVRKREDIPLERFMLFLESVGRAKFHIFIDEENKFVQPSDVPIPTPLEMPKPPSQDKKYLSAIQQYADPQRPSPYAPGIQEAIVCGPPGYLRYMTGDPGMHNDSPIGGLLGSKGWNLENTKRMNDL